VKEARNKVDQRSGASDSHPLTAEPRASILVVDDHPANLVALEAILAPLGHQLVMARSGVEALREILHREFALIREGNMAASFSLSGSILGFVIPLASAVQHSVSLVDMAIWGLIAMLVQIAAFVAVKLMLPSITQDIPANKGAQGFFLGCMSLAVGVLNAACMSY